MFFFFAEGSEEPLTLYIQHDHRAKPDVTTVAKVLLHYEASLQQIASYLDPTVSIRVELRAVEDGSLRLITRLKTAKEKFAQYPLTIGIVGTFTGYMLSNIGSYGITNALDYILKETPQVHLTREAIESVSKAAAEACRVGAGQTEAKKIYQELHGDPAITGVSVIAGNHKNKPKIIVPRSEFAERGTLIEDVATDSRKVVKPETIILIRPDLTTKKRKWVFSSSGTEFKANVLDEQFLRSINNGSSDIPLSYGIAMEVLLESTEEKINGVWLPLKKNVLRIISVHPPLRQKELGFDHSKKQQY